MIIILNVALPAVMPIPPENPSISLRKKRKNKVVRSSGIELAMALIVAPFMPFDRFLPRKLDAVVKLFADFPIIKQLMEIRIRGIKIPINEIIIIYLNVIKGYKNTIF